MVNKLLFENINANDYAKIGSNKNSPTAEATGLLAAIRGQLVVQR